MTELGKLPVPAYAGVPFNGLLATHSKTVQEFCSKGASRFNISSLLSPLRFWNSDW